MFERFTERARQVVVLAQEEARRQECDDIRPEHVLCGLFKEGEGLAARILASNFLLSYERAQQLIEPGHTKELKQIPFTDSAKMILEGALREALTLGHNYIGTEHILLGIAREGEKNTPGITPVNLYFVEEFTANKINPPEKWPEIIRREVEEVLSGPRPRKVPEDLSPEENEEVDAREIVADLKTGFEMWRGMKGDELDDADEMLVRWVAGSKANDYLS